MSQHPYIPSFFLFGEAPRLVEERFLHLESLDQRSRPNQWRIKAHGHDNLSHLFHITQGEGLLSCDGETLGFVGPCLVLVPARAVHAFEFQTDAAGSVLTVSHAYLQDLILRERQFGQLFDRAHVLTLHDRAVDVILAGLARELAWTAAAHAAAVEACLLSLLVEAVRVLGRRGAPPQDHGAGQAMLVARFREAIEERFRSNDPLERYAGRLGVTVARLRDACLRVAGASPSRLIRDRVLLEAKRTLLYSDATVAQAGYQLGFADPAYFSRFFSKETGECPRAYRSRRSRREAVGAD